MVLTLLFYGSFEMVTLIERGNSTVTQSTIDNYFGADTVFDIDKKGTIQIAFGITAYDAN